jgi:Tfp pilus assembly protein FimT
LIELVLVMGIVAVAAAVAMPRWASANAAYRTEAAARRIMADLAYASTLARVGSTEIKIKFKKGDKPDESVYWFETVDDPDRPGEVYTIVLREPPYRVTLTKAPNDLTFAIDGMPTDSATFIVRGDASHQRSVVVNKSTGEVTMQ